MSTPTGHRFLSDLDGVALQAAKDIALQKGGPLRLAWLDQRYTGAGRLALSPLPGDKRYLRTLAGDLDTLRQQSVNNVLCLLEDHEFTLFGVTELLASYNAAGFVIQRYPIRDHGVCAPEVMREIVNWLSRSLDGGAHIVVHCAGGLGRSGIVAACYLTSIGLSADAAIAEVRNVRSPFAIESTEQEAFVRAFCCLKE